MVEEHWKNDPDDHDYPAARSYLSLLADPSVASALAKKLENKESLDHFAAKDILRASGLPLLPKDDPEVAKDMQKVLGGTKLSPALLVRGSPLWIADGYHRVCVSYHIDPKTSVPCKIVDHD
jgi:hypothetical protein